ncbi:MAG: alkaline phosphatase family protein [Thaumarchaeota archaeon]|nr:alkaline phosphatase family protein [Nitrososphaerota archaeon]MDG6905704.1 phosphoesterase [Nitrososphaerota archaeon]
MKLGTKVKNLVIVSILVLAALGAYTFGGSAFATVSSASNQTSGALPFTHVFYIMMENHGTDSIVGSSNAPYINNLINTYGYDNNYYGVTHVSLPNYVAAISGNNWYSNSDDPTQMFNHTNIVDQLETNHISWKAYMEDLPSAGFSGYWYPDNLPNGTSPSVTPSNALYAKKHDPFMLFTDIANNPARTNNVVPLTQLTTDLSTNHVPQFVWISPNVCNDMHGQPPGDGATCPYTNDTALIQDGNNFLQQWVTAIMNSKAWTGNSVIFITWDEAEYPNANPTAQEIATFTAPGPDSPIVPAGVNVAGINWNGGAFGGGQVPLIVISRLSPQHVVINTWADHYSILRTIEASWTLGYLGMVSDGAQVQTLSGFFQPGHHEASGIGLSLASTDAAYLELARTKA